MRKSILPAVGLLVLSTPAVSQISDGERLFQTYCAACHVNPQQEEVPSLQALSALSANAVVQSLTEGTMTLQGQPLAPAQRVAIAEFVTGSAYLAQAAPFESGLCAARPGLPALQAGTVWNGWGPDAHNARFQRDTGGLAAGDVGRLRLKWAFGIPDVTQSRSQPAVAGDRLFIASQSGAVFALDARTGCTYWTYRAMAGVRTAISVGPVPGGYAVYFADGQARAYAIDMQTGSELWTRKVDDHPAARATGAPTLYGGRLYVPIAGVSEESAASRPNYECCTFRGSVTALDAATGEVLWKTYTVPEPQPRGRSSTGAPLWGPAGVAIWSAPTVDAGRGLVYIGTGNAYADPAPGTSDSVIALDMQSGAIRWVRQLLPDIWIMGCDAQSARGNPNPGDNPNCPEEVGPDFDINASPALITTDAGRDLLVVTQKSGLGYALDPDREGAVLWEYRWGAGSPVGGVYGATTDGRQAYFAVADQFTDAPGGVHGVDLLTGERRWHAPPASPLCGSGQGCSAAQSAALTSIPGIVFSGSADGGVRAYAADTGEVVWTFDTNRSFDTVNGVEARGGSMDGPGPIVAGGLLYVTAGNGGIVGRPGNVLLAFEAED